MLANTTESMLMALQMCESRAKVLQTEVYRFATRNSFPFKGLIMLGRDMLSHTCPRVNGEVQNPRGIPTNMINPDYNMSHLFIGNVISL